LIQDAVIRNLEVIGEASRNLQKHFPAFSSEHPELPLSYAWQMRNAIAHGYFAIDFRIVWETVKKDLRPLADKVKKIQNAPQ